MPLGPDLWYTALASEYGIVVLTNDPIRAQQKLYEIREGLADPDLKSISIMTSPDDHNEIWLVKRPKE
jgi:hypothetical protein